MWCDQILEDGNAGGNDDTICTLQAVCATCVHLWCALRFGALLVGLAVGNPARIVTVSSEFARCKRCVASRSPDHDDGPRVDWTLHTEVNTSHQLCWQISGIFGIGQTCSLSKSMFTGPLNIARNSAIVGTSSHRSKLMTASALGIASQ
jgi:hypothetical protein